MYMFKKYERRVIYSHFRFVTFTKFISAHFQTILKGKMVFKEISVFVFDFMICFVKSNSYIDNNSIIKNNE